ncbi:MAG: phosphoenolpyruvate carboxykinase (GTP) [Nanoarchaeota archaeon]|nr:phosphoenolpyruvate carboxykinase (GTP) [Nanoarchaeota archaeon]MBU1946137.1 phosphoenolpyruvate carboxykinase (GTP) [Nanoarchaeota archaeon]
MNIDKTILDENNLKKLEELKNPKVMKIVEEYVNLCKPRNVTVITDSNEDISYVRELAVRNGEESKLKMEGHTIHFDGMIDQGRDKKNTQVLLPKDAKPSKFLKWKERAEGLKEVMGFLDGIMKGKEMLVCFFCLGPNNSNFSIPALQLTDSSYVLHSETILYRLGYGEFKRLNGSGDFFYFVHSAGELDERNNSKNIDKRRIYMDLQENRVLTVNNQYAGNSVGLKKLALRLAINKSNKEDWLCEHMFVMGVHALDGKRVTYFTGAYPSACGKTSTAMVPGQSIIGDDIAYLRAGDDGIAYAVNVEQGIFGIIKDINSMDDPIIYTALTTPRELIFSNVLNVDGVPHWLNMGKEIPSKGINFSGEWYGGKKDKDGKLIDPAHKNSRYTIRINELENADPKADDPNGVPVSGFLYGGRDADTTVPVFESLSWSHGVYVGAIVESETTTATLGKAGVRTHDPMANIDFLVVPFGLYIKNHLAFGDRLDKPPRIFHTNYFLKHNGEFLNSKLDKKIWLLWVEGRVHNEFNAIETPIGFIPTYDDLKGLFKKVFDRDYTKEEYEQQFSIRIPKLLEKLDRMEKVYGQEEGLPEVFLEHLKQEKERLLKAKEKFGKEVIGPFEF